jgi:hypothetical protein
MAGVQGGMESHVKQVISWLHVLREKRKQVKRRSKQNLMMYAIINNSIQKNKILLR